MDLIGKIMNDQKFIDNKVCERCNKVAQIVIKYGAGDNEILCRDCYSQEVRNAMFENKNRHIDDFIDIIKIITNIEKI